jgi:hypothetical protein
VFITENGRNITYSSLPLVPQVTDMLLDPILVALEKELRSDFHKALTGLLATALERLEGALAEVAEERTKGLAEVTTRRAELGREVAAMQQHKEAQEGRVELNIGGYRFETSVQTLRRVPHTFFDAYFSGRYAQDVCYDGSIFVDRDGEHFGHVLQYMRDGVVSVAEPGVCPSVSLLRALKREFGFYCIEVVAEQPAEPKLPEMAFVVGGMGDEGRKLSSMERYDASSGQWSAVAAMNTRCNHVGICVIAGELYRSGGLDGNEGCLSSVEKYSPLSDSWSVVAPMPTARHSHAAVAVGSAMYVLGGYDGDVAGSALKFDSAQGTWSQVAPMPVAIYDSAACAIGSDIFIFGGYCNALGGDQDSTFKYDTVADAWSTLAPMPHASSDHRVSVLDGLVYIVGVGDGSNVLRFDPASDVWSTLAPTLNNRGQCCSFVLGGCLYAAGGEGIDALSVERYDVTTDTWEAVADMLEARTGFSAVTIGYTGPAEEQDLFDSLIAKASSDR